LAKAGYLTILEAGDLAAAKLAAIIKKGLHTHPPAADKLRLQGDRESAAIINRLLDKETRS
jgi:predicted glycosyltransferase